jgi:hypothetical protein
MHTFPFFKQRILLGKIITAEVQSRIEGCKKPTTRRYFESYEERETAVNIEKHMTGFDATSSE